MRLADSDQCVLGELISDGSYSIFDQAKDACWSVGWESADTLQFSADLFLFDTRHAKDIRPWSRVPLRCDMGTKVAVNPITVNLVENVVDAVGTTASTPSELGLKVIANETNLAVASSEIDLGIGQVVMFFVETTYAELFDLALHSCTYQNIPLAIGGGPFNGDYVTNQIPSGFSTGYSFERDFSGFIMRIYNNLDADSDQVICSARIQLT